MKSTIETMPMAEPGSIRTKPNQTGDRQGIDSFKSEIGSAAEERDLVSYRCRTRPDHDCGSFRNFW